MTSIKRRAEAIKKKLDFWNDKYYALQKECTHPNSTHEYRANTGNYDPHHDSYWIDYYCPDCDKHWRKPQ